MRKSFHWISSKYKTLSPRLKKGLRLFIWIIIVVPIVVIIFISPITKYLVEKYDVKYTGREIEMDWAYVNPFTGYVHLSNLKIHEYKSDSLFFSSKGVSANFQLLKMLSGNYEISELVLDRPNGIIIQEEKTLNLDDVVKKFSGDSSKPAKSPTHFSILKIVIVDGEFHYREKTVPVNYFIKEVNIESSGIRWNEDTIAGTFSFIPGIGTGKMKGDITINFKTLDYRLNTVINKFDLNFIGQYLNELANYGSFSANLDADIKASGNFLRAEDLNAKGLLAINAFRFGLDSTVEYASFDKLELQILDLSPKNHKYIFDSITLHRPFFKYERYDHLDNVQTMFGEKGANVSSVTSSDKFNLVIEIGNYVKLLSRNFFASYYQVKRLAIYDGNMVYNDYSLDEKFTASANPLNIIADSIDKNHDRVKLSFTSGILPYGNMKLNLSINPKDSTDFDLTYHFEKFSVPMLNPYIIKYTSFATDRGSVEISGDWHVRNSFINSNNHLIILDPRLACRVKNEDSKYIPMRMVMALVRESGNVIDYEIPISGNLKDPNFHLWDAITDILGNIFVKPLTTPYRLQVKNTEKEIEKSISLRWMPRQNKLEDSQEKFLRKMADFLEDNPTASISIFPVEYEAKEKEAILFFEAKKKYYLETNNKSAKNFSEDDSLDVEDISIKDSIFIRHLNKHVPDTLMFTVQQKCLYYVGEGIVSARFNELKKERSTAFMASFKENGTSKRVKLAANENAIPFSGFSFYKIDYKGEMPKSLRKAYAELDNLNGENPRRKYLRLRKKYNNLMNKV